MSVSFPAPALVWDNCLLLLLKAAVLRRTYPAARTASPNAEHASSSALLPLAPARTPIDRAMSGHHRSAYADAIKVTGTGNLFFLWPSVPWAR